MGIIKNFLPMHPQFIQSLLWAAVGSSHWINLSTRRCGFCCTHPPLVVDLLKSRYMEFCRRIQARDLMSFFLPWAAGLVQQIPTVLAHWGFGFEEAKLIFFLTLGKVCGITAGHLMDTGGYSNPSNTPGIGYWADPCMSFCPPAV